jgi:hypothetical protein
MLFFTFFSPHFFLWEFFWGFFVAFQNACGECKKKP